MINRQIEASIKNSLRTNPSVAILGPRQCGKTTLAKKIIQSYPEAVYLDLESPTDLAKLENAEWYFSQNGHRLICIDEIQRKPEIFAVIRSTIDKTGQNGQFLILGSASRDLIKQSSESLAGRISYHKLTPFLVNEVKKNNSIEEYLSRGGFPRSLLAATDDDSIAWREDFITTFLERDILQWIGVSPLMIRRLWQMLAHNNGQSVNYSSIGNALGISNVSVKNYIDLLAGTFMVKIVSPWFSNLGKRLVKSPRIYISDSGIATALLGLDSFERTVGHPSFGALWESLVLSNVEGNFPKAGINFYRSLQGAEMDFIIQYKGKIIAVECKTSITPLLTRGNHQSIKDIEPDKTLVIAPVEKGWERDKDTLIAPLDEALSLMNNIFSNRK